MKYKAKEYAKALVNIISQKKTPAEEKKIINNFFKLLVKNGDLKKAKEMILLAEDLYLKRSGSRKIIIQTARKISDKNIFKNILKKDDVIKEEINPSLIAGVKIIINNEKQLDFSLKRKIEETFI